VDLIIGHVSAEEGKVRSERTIAFSGLTRSPGES
jgi:hypothetical protein